MIVYQEASSRKTIVGVPNSGRLKVLEGREKRNCPGPQRGPQFLQPAAASCGCKRQEGRHPALGSGLGFGRVVGPGSLAATVKEH